MQEREITPVGGHLEDCAITVRSAISGRPIQPAVRALDQAGRRITPIRRGSEKAVEQCKATSVGRHLKDRAEKGGTAGKRRSVQRTVGGLNEPSSRTAAVCWTT